MNRSMQKLGLVALAAGVSGAVLVSAIPDADASRRASLAGNQLILDKNDVYTFPQVGVEYTNLLNLDYGTATGSGSGLALLGDDSMAFGVGVFRGDLLDPDFFPYTMGNPNLGNISTIGVYPQPHTVLDLFGSFDLGAGLAGARLSFGNGGNKATDLEELDTGESQTFIAATLGYSLLGDLRLDTSLRLQYTSGTAYTDDVNDSSGSDIYAGINARGFSPLSDSVDLGFLANIAFNSSSLTVFGDPDIDGDDDIIGRSSGFLASAGVGPAYDIDGVTTLAGYGVIGYSRRSTDPNIDDEVVGDASANTATVLPGLHLAADIQLLDWLYFRSGMQYSFQLASSITEFDIEGNDDAVRDTAVQRNRGSDFGWRAGIGIEVQNFTLDGTFQSGFILNGPDFLGGAGGGMFTMVSAGYTF